MADSVVPEDRAKDYFGDPAGITIRNMRTFFWLARLRNYHAVARQMNVTQPAITARIAALEEDLGLRLFSRGPQGLALTPEGKDALRLCENVLDHVDALLRLYSDSARRLGGIARIGVVDTVARTWLPAVLNRMQQDCPDVLLEITNEGTRELHALLKAGSLSMCVTISECDDPDVVNTPVGSFEMEWVASPALIEPGRTYDIEELVRLPLIGYVPQSPPDEHLRRHLGKHYSSHGIRNTTNSMSTMIWLAESGLGIAAIPPRASPQHLADGRLVIARTTQAFEPMPFYLNCRNRPWSPVVRIIESVVREEAARF